MSKYHELANRLMRWPSLDTLGTGLHEDLSAAAAELLALEAERNALIEALEEFGQHDGACGIRVGYGRCDCGLQELLDRFREPK